MYLLVEKAFNNFIYFQRGGKISTGNPCPICRDEYLVLHHENVDLLKQFISPHTGEVLSYS
jgi:small subunit ribosomal protein S18b